MAFTRIEYGGRLPYGLWFDPETGMETIFDRGYKAIAQRPVSQPEAAVLVQPRKHISAPIEVWFYTDSDSPSIRKEAEARCETIFTRFMLGCDVRGFVELDSRDQVRTIWGNYLALWPRLTEALEDRLEFGPA